MQWANMQFHTKIYVCKICVYEYISIDGFWLEIYRVEVTTISKKV